MPLITSISGIRGTIGGKVGENLTPVDVVKFTVSYAIWLKKNNDRVKVVVGRDARLSGVMINRLVCATLQGVGVDVLDLGLSTTPTVEYAVPVENAQGGIIITASHNPKEWNALKLLNKKGECISSKDGEEILSISEKTTHTFSQIDDLGTYVQDNGSYISKHIDHITKLDIVDTDSIRESDFSVVMDAVNSTGGIVLPLLLEKLGVKKITPLYCTPNGEFPHNPEPLKEHLTDISEAVVKEIADLGIVVDPDVDRLALINEDGSMFGEEYTLVACADYVLSRSKGSVVSNLSSSRALRDVAQRHNCTYQASAVGEVNVVAKMKEVNAVIGGEGNGGIIYPNSHYGRDALVGIALFLSHLAHKKQKMTLLKKSYPGYFMSKNKIQLTPEIDVDDLLSKFEKIYSHEEISTIDGLKIDFEQKWIHLRKSNTEPIVRIYTEAKSQVLADELAQQAIHHIKSML